MPLICNCTDGRIVIDDRHPPILIAEFAGKQAIEDAKWHMAEQQRLVTESARRGMKTISVVDATLSKKPDAEARKYWADSMSTTPQAVQDATLATIVVINSAVIRGALTAIGWLNPKAKELITCATLEEALFQAFRHAEAAGLRTPSLDPTRYTFPTDGSRSTG